MKKQKTNKKSKELKVLAAAAVVTAVTVAGSTFAWLSSKDEVTNRLAVKSSYRTAIYETDFNPPTNWEVGQTVDKNVSIVNSGNIDAIVKVSIGGTATMTYWGKGGTTVGNGVPNDNEYRKLNLSEVTAIEAGGRLVTTTASGQEYSNCSTADPYEFTITNNGSFTAAGFYIFKRSDAEGTYSGYYCDGAVSPSYYALWTKVTAADASNPNTVISLELDGVSEDTTNKIIKGYELMKKQTDSTNEVKPDYDYSKVSSDKKITVNLKEKTEPKTTLATFEITLANIGNGAAQWTYIDEKGFYYNNDLEASAENDNDKTSQLIDSVRFVRANAYFENLVYNLDISHESVQVVIGTDDKECLPGADTGNETVKPFGESDGVNATASHDTDNKEIASIKWELAASSTT